MWKVVGSSNDCIVNMVWWFEAHTSLLAGPPGAV